MLTAVKRVLEGIAMAKVSTSAQEARGLGLLLPADRITMNRERLLLEAKAQAAVLAETGYMAPQPRTIPAPGIAALATMETGIYMMGEAGYASEHDQKVAQVGGVHPGRRAGDGGCDCDGAVFARFGTRGVFVAVRGAKDAGADRVHAENRKAAAELTYVRM